MYLAVTRAVDQARDVPRPRRCMTACDRTV